MMDPGLSMKAGESMYFVLGLGSWRNFTRSSGSGNEGNVSSWVIVVAILCERDSFNDLIAIIIRNYTVAFTVYRSGSP